MINIETPWAMRFDVHMSDDELARKLISTIHPVSGLDDLPSYTASERLRKHLQQIFVPNIPVIRLVRRMLETGYTHAISAYADITAFVRRINSTSSHVTGYSGQAEPPIWCVTGLAGTGKSATLRSVRRLLGEAPMFQATDASPKLPIVGAVFVEMKNGSKNSDILRQLADQLGTAITVRGERASPETTDILRRQMYMRGVSLLVVDETQFTANGKTGGAALVNRLQYLQRFGVPVVFVSNYSMCHALLTQHSQNRQRLLQDPHVLTTLDADDPSYREYLRSYVYASSGVLKIDPDADAHKIHHLTGGGGRALEELVVLAYRICRESGQKNGPAVVTVADLEIAYCSGRYDSYRKEIEMLREHVLSGKKIRKDMLCPFPESDATQQSIADAKSNVLKTVIARKMLESSYTKEERRAMSEGTLAEPTFIESGEVLERSQTNAPRSTSENILRTAAVSVNARPPKRPKRPRPTLSDATRDWG